MHSLMQTTIPETFENLNDALKEAVRAAGGNKRVGALLRPELPLDQAAQWVRDSLNPDRRDKLSPEQVLLVLRLACEAGYHGAMAYFAFGASYEAPRPVTPQDQETELQRQFVAAVEALQTIQSQLGKVQGSRRRA